MSADPSTNPSAPARPAGRPPGAMPPPAPGTGLTTARPSAAARTGTASADPVAARPTRPSLASLLTRGAVWGAVAIGVAALLQMWAATAAGDQAVRPLRLMVTLLEGGPGLVDGDPLVGVAVNVGIGAVLGILFALATPRMRASRTVLLAALVYAAGVFAVETYLVAPRLPLLALREEPLLLSVRLVMGAVLALGFLDAPRRVE